MIIDGRTWRDKIWDKCLRKIRGITELLAESMRPEKLENLKQARLLLEDAMHETRRAVEPEQSANQDERESEP
jgi:hypothetical protein